MRKRSEFWRDNCATGGITQKFVGMIAQSGGMFQKIGGVIVQFGEVVQKFGEMVPQAEEWFGKCGNDCATGGMVPQLKKGLSGWRSGSANAVDLRRIINCQLLIVNY